MHVPVPLPELSTHRLLTMTWLDGRPLMQRLAEDPPQEERNKIAEALFRAWYVPFYRYGVIHGDPHLGNYQVRPDGSVNLLDFGAIRVFGARFVAGVIELFEAVRDHDDDKAHHAYETWGFTDLSREKMDVLNMWARFLYEPFTQDRVRRIQETDDPHIWPRSGRTCACRAEAYRRGDASARIRADGPVGDRSGRCVPAVEGRIELEPPVQRLDGRVRRSRRGRTSVGGVGGSGCAAGAVA